MKKNLLAMLLAVVMIAAVVFIAAPATKATDANVITAQVDGEEIPAAAGDTVDLAGKKNVKITVTGDGAIYLVDSFNLEDLTGAKSGSAIVNGAVADWVQHSDGFKYLAVKNGDTYSAHPFNFTIDKYGVNTHYSAVSARVTVIADDTVAALIDAGEFGLRNYTLGESTEADKKAKEYSAHWEKFGDKNGIRGYFYLENSLTSDVLTANASCKLGAYVKINGKTINSLQTVELTPTELLKTVNSVSQMRSYSKEQKDKMKAMIAANDHLKAYCDNFLLRDVTDSLLTAEEKAALAALTAEEYNAAAAESTITNLDGIGSWLYKQAGIDVYGYLDQSVFNIIEKGKLFNKSTPWTIPTTDNKYLEMLVTGYYGGKAFAEGSSKTFDINYFEVGDLFCAYTQEKVGTETVRKYYIALYQGDGKFLEINNENDGWTVYEDKTTALNDDIATFFQCYYVLRPSQLAKADNGMTKAQEDALWRKLSALTADNTEYKKKTNDTGVVKWFCIQEGMSTDVVDDNFYGIVNISGQLFNKSGTWTVKQMDSENNKYHKLFVEGYYGGASFKTGNDTGSGKILTVADLEIGDIFCAQDTSKNRYVGLYQGDGKFLMYSCNSSSSNDNYSADYTQVFNADMATKLNYYYVLRPTQYLYPTN